MCQRARLHNVILAVHKYLPTGCTTNRVVEGRGQEVKGSSRELRSTAGDPLHWNYAIKSAGSQSDLHDPVQMVVSPHRCTRGAPTRLGYDIRMSYALLREVLYTRTTAHGRTYRALAGILRFVVERNLAFTTLHRHCGWEGPTPTLHHSRQPSFLSSLEAGRSSWTTAESVLSHDWCR
jgi:hypothetical protein